jgi:dienelactone hydrolase
MSLQAVASRDEQPVFFPAGPETLFGILTSPPARPRGTAVVLLQGAGYVISANHNGLWARLARALAARGWHALRLDYHGVGESTGRFERVRLDRLPTLDLLGAVDWLAGAGVGRAVVVGSCFGARVALEAAPEIAALAGVALLGPPLRVVADDGQADRAEVAAMLRGLAGLAARGIPCLVAYGLDDNPEHRRFGELLAGRPDAAAGARVEALPGELRGLPALGVQQAVADLVLAWLDGLPEGAGR